MSPRLWPTGLRGVLKLTRRRLLKQADEETVVPGAKGGAGRADPGVITRNAARSAPTRSRRDPPPSGAGSGEGSPAASRRRARAWLDQPGSPRLPPSTSSPRSGARLGQTESGRGWRPPARNVMTHLAAIAKQVGSLHGCCRVQPPCAVSLRRRLRSNLARRPEERLDESPASRLHVRLPVGGNAV